jgi:uncharacterized protein with GYD domain
MAWFLIEGTYTAAAKKALVTKPQDRAESVRPMIEKAGGKLHHLFFTFGDCDIVALAELPGHQAAMAMAMTVSAAGHMASYKTRELFPSHEVVEAMRAAQSMRLATPGSSGFTRSPTKRFSPSIQAAQGAVPRAHKPVNQA